MNWMIHVRPAIRVGLFCLIVGLSYPSPAGADKTGKTGLGVTIEALGWIKAPPDQTAFEPLSVGVDFRGQVLVLDGARRRLLRFSAAGDLLGHFGRSGGERAGLSDPTGLACYRGFATLVVDRGRGEVVRYDRHGGLLSGWDISRSSGEGFIPWGITVGDDGNVYLTDPVSGRIVVLGPDGTHLRQIRDIGSELGGFVSPGYLAVRDGFIYFSDRDNDRIVVLNRWGRVQAAWGSSGSDAGSLKSPRGIAVDSRGRVWVADAGNRRIQVFTAEGAPIAVYPAGDDQLFLSPEALAVGPDGAILIVDSGRRALFRGRYREAPDRPGKVKQ